MIMLSEGKKLSIREAVFSLSIHSGVTVQETQNQMFQKITDLQPFSS